VTGWSKRRSRRPERRERPKGRRSDRAPAAPFLPLDEGAQRRSAGGAGSPTRAALLHSRPRESPTARHARATPRPPRFCSPPAVVGRSMAPASSASPRRGRAPQASGVLRLRAGRVVLRACAPSRRPATAGPRARAAAS
jgi:hypothetical protein